MVVADFTRVGAFDASRLQFLPLPVRAPPIYVTPKSATLYTTNHQSPTPEHCRGTSPPFSPIIRQLFSVPA